MEQDEERPRTKRTKAEREALLAELRGSGKSVREFAAEHGVPASSVYQWRQTQRKASSKSKKRKDATKPGKSAFTEVSVVGDLAAPASRGSGLTVALAWDHVRIRHEQRRRSYGRPLRVQLLVPAVPGEGLPGIRPRLRNGL